METGQGPGHPLWQNIIIMRCHEACAKTKSKLTSPLERERGRSQNKSQAVPRLFPGWCRVGGICRWVQPVLGGLGMQPGSCSPPALTEPPTSSAMGRRL